MLSIKKIIARPSGSGQLQHTIEAPTLSSSSPSSSSSSAIPQRRRSRRHTSTVQKHSSVTSKTVQRSLLHVRLRAQDADGLQQSCPNEECVICAESFHTDDVVTVLPCGHMHHSNCILHWLDRQCTCPTCRFDLKKHAQGKQPRQLQEVDARLVLNADTDVKNNSNATSICQQKSENFDLIMRRTLRMKMEAQAQQLDEESDSSDSSSSGLDRRRPDANHAHFLELYAGYSDS